MLATQPAREREDWAPIAGASAYLLVKAVGLGAPLAGVIGIVVVMLLRRAAILWGIQLPVVTPRDE